MSDVHDLIPRSTLTTEQQRRLGALQAAKRIAQGGPRYGSSEPLTINVGELLRLADYITRGDT